MSAIQRVGLFGTLNRTNILLVISMLRETHASEISRILDISLSQVQKGIDSLERAGVLVGTVEGKARRVQINPRYPYRDELQALLDKMTIQDVALQQRLGEIRRRPRRAGKTQ